jgi:hypothetical protein
MPRCIAGITPVAFYGSLDSLLALFPFIANVGGMARNSKFQVGSGVVENAGLRHRIWSSEGQ